MSYSHDHIQSSSIAPAIDSKTTLMEPPPLSLARSPIVFSIPQKRKIESSNLSGYRPFKRKMGNESSSTAKALERDTGPGSSPIGDRPTTGKMGTEKSSTDPRLRHRMETGNSSNSSLEEGEVATEDSPKKRTSKSKPEIVYTLADLKTLLHPAKYDPDPLLSLLYPPSSLQEPDLLFDTLLETIADLSCSGTNNTVTEIHEEEAFLGGAVWAKYTPESRNMVRNSKLFKELREKGELHIHALAIAEGSVKESLGDDFNCYLLLRLFVHSACRRKGAGSTIVKRFLQEADSEAIPVLAHSSPKIAPFWLNLGFTVINTYPLNLSDYDGGTGFYQLSLMMRMPYGIPIMNIVKPFHHFQKPTIAAEKGKRKREEEEEEEEKLETVKTKTNGRKAVDVDDGKLAVPEKAKPVIPANKRRVVLFDKEIWRR